MLTSNCASQQMDVLTKFSGGKKLLQIEKPWAGGSWEEEGVNFQARHIKGAATSSHGKVQTINIFSPLM